MYIPHHYKNENLSEVRQFLKDNAFAILVNQVDGKPWATHIPIEIETDASGTEYLIGHVARANRQWKSFDSNQEVLCIFNGPHAYVSSSWYRDEEVPTWNYIAVHIYGTIEILDEATLLASLHSLVDKYERHSKNPLSLHDLSKKTMRQIKGIVGFKVHISGIQAAYKLSQGREHDHPSIIEELEKRSDEAAQQIAKHIRK